MKVANPANAKIHRYSGQMLDENGAPAGTRHIHTSTNSEGDERKCTVELVGSFAKSDPLQLSINDKAFYGSAVKGDSIVIDRDAVKVNGEGRAVAK